MTTHLPLTVETLHKYLEKDTLSSVQVVILQHLWQDTYYFIQHLLEAGVRITAVFGKPLSVDPEIVGRIEAYNIPVHILPYDTLDSSEYMLPILKSIVNKKGIRTLFLEVGCYFGQHIKKLPSRMQKKVTGIIEITKFGHNRHQAILRRDKVFSVPIISLACSTIKEIEATFVTQAGLEALSQVFRSINYTLYGKSVGLLGFGMIHQSLLTWLTNYNLRLYTYDTDKTLQKTAKKRGAIRKSKTSLLHHAQIIFSATGQQSITCDEIEKNARNHAILVSLGSRGREFPVQEMNTRRNHVPLNQYIDVYTTSTGKILYLINKGVAINYLIQSCVAEVMDVYFSEMVYALHMLLHKKVSVKKIHTTPKHIQKKLVHQWLNLLKISYPIIN